jgi:hypothetical protein
LGIICITFPSSSWLNSLRIVCHRECATFIPNNHFYYRILAQYEPTLFLVDWFSYRAQDGPGGYKSGGSIAWYSSARLKATAKQVGDIYDEERRGADSPNSMHKEDSGVLMHTNDLRNLSLPFFLWYFLVLANHRNFSHKNFTIQIPIVKSGKNSIPGIMKHKGNKLIVLQGIKTKINVSVLETVYLCHLSHFLGKVARCRLSPDHVGLQWFFSSQNWEAIKSMMQYEIWVL